MFQGPLLRSAAAASVALVVLSGAACSNDGEPGAGPTSPSPSPTPSRIQAEPVEGEVEVQLFAVSNEQAVWDRALPEPDPGAVDQVAGRVASWLDAHLSDVQEGGEGALEDVAAGGLLDGAAPATVDAVTVALASPERLVERATYTLVVAHTDAPQWVRASAHVTAREGGTRTAHFVFEVVEDGVALVAAGPGPEEGRS